MAVAKAVSKRAQGGKTIWVIRRMSSLGRKAHELERGPQFRVAEEMRKARRLVWELGNI